MEKLWCNDRRDRDKAEGSGQGLGKKTSGQGCRTFTSNDLILRFFSEMAI